MLTSSASISISKFVWLVCEQVAYNLVACSHLDRSGLQSLRIQFSNLQSFRLQSLGLQSLGLQSLAVIWIAIKSEFSGF